MERTPGRNWINTGYGANVQSVDFGSPSGGRGKPVKMYVQPFSSPPVIGMRSGAYNGGYPMCIVYPQVSGHDGFIKPVQYQGFLSFRAVCHHRHPSPRIPPWRCCQRLFTARLLATAAGPVGSQAEATNQAGVGWCPGLRNSAE